MNESKICGIRKARGGICQREATVLTEEKGLICTRHYVVFRRNNLIKRINRICKADNCDRPIRSNGYCAKHDGQIRRCGKILNIIRDWNEPNEIVVKGAIAEMTLYNRFGEPIAVTLFDAEEREKIEKYKWHLSNVGYVGKNNPRCCLHRLILGTPPINKEVDHINRNKLDNRKRNLRFVTRQQNAMNGNLRTNNSSGITGLTWDKEHLRWIAQIMVNGKHYHLGRFKNKQDAIRARKKAERRRFGEYAPRG